MREDEMKVRLSLLNHHYWGRIYCHLHWRLRSNRKQRWDMEAMRSRRRHQSCACPWCRHQLHACRAPRTQAPLGTASLKCITKSNLGFTWNATRLVRRHDGDITGGDEKGALSSNC